MYRHTISRAQYDTVAACCQCNADYIIVRVKIDCNDAACSRVTVSREFGLFYKAVFSSHNKLALLRLFLFSGLVIKFAHIDYGCYCLIAELQEIYDISAFALSGHTRDVIALQPVAFAAIGNDKLIIVRGGGEEMLKKITLFGV